MSREARRRDDQGSATAEFVMLGTLVVLIAIGLVQLVLALHVRNVLLSSAQEGARHAAAADRAPADGASRALEVAGASIPGVSAAASAEAITVAGAPAVSVTVSAPVPVLGWWGPADIDVTARALEEQT
ncbi:TadE family protein [Demequina litorisediminis]|uniref:TadE family protein n=1 Tax=Demequina litorisediminis TaxID=1849022 RepID=UPI0024E14D8A|nr:TadE family protein [Demequina litorisediminis]